MKSNRPQHLAVNTIAALSLIAADCLLFNPDTTSLISGVSCIIMERWASPDRDIERQRRLSIPGLYWRIYAAFIPRHRHPYSHSLIPGLILRTLWGFWPLLLIAPHDAPLPIVARVLFGITISDITHLSMDGYSFIQIAIGKNR